jgi:hypothetical protein
MPDDKMVSYRKYSDKAKNKSYQKSDKFGGSDEG